jgi:hypothetical protein
MISRVATNLSRRQFTDDPRLRETALHCDDFDFAGHFGLGFVAEK